MSHFKHFVLVSAVILINAQFLMADITRVEQDDPSITYSGNWYTNGSESNSASSAALTNTSGSGLVFTFTGTAVTWIGIRDPWSGLANVVLDGIFQKVDTWGPTTAYQVPLFTASALSIGPHTLSIEITHERDTNGVGSWVWVDAFDVENGAPINGGITASVGRVEDNSPALVYSGAWYASTNVVHSGGSATLAVDPGATVTLNFTGTGVDWITYRDEWSGLARVFLDGNLVAEVDTYLSPWAARTTLYRIEGLPPGDHSLAIQATGTHNQSAKGAWVWVDAFDVEQ